MAPRRSDAREPQHGTWGHTIWFSPAHLYEEAVRIPLIVVHPSGAVGATSDRLVGQVDFASTLLELAGVAAVEFEGSAGRSFASAVHDPVRDAAVRAKDGEPDAVFFEQEESRGLRTERYAYWKRLDGFGEPALFDLASDPAQEHDLCATLAADESGSRLIAALDARLEGFFNEYSDPAHDLWKGGISVERDAEPNGMGGCSGPATRRFGFLARRSVARSVS